jgi:hypothetical protein
MCRRAVRRAGTGRAESEALGAASGPAGPALGRAARAARVAGRLDTVQKVLTEAGGSTPVPDVPYVGRQTSLVRAEEPFAVEVNQVCGIVGAPRVGLPRDVRKVLSQLPAIRETGDVDQPRSGAREQGREFVPSA